MSATHQYGIRESKAEYRFPETPGKGRNEIVLEPIRWLNAGTQVQS